MKIYNYLIACVISSMAISHVSADSPWPVATEDRVTLTSNQRVYIPVLNNDIGQDLAIIDVDSTTVKSGRVEIGADRKAVYYQSAENFTGEDSFWYAFEDNIGRTNAAKVILQVTDDEDDYDAWPVANVDTASTSQNTSITIPVLANDRGQNLTLSDVDSWTAKGGRAFIQGDSVVYTPRWNFTGEDSFWYAFYDARGRTNSTKVKVSVFDDETPPEQAAFTLVTMHDDLLKRRYRIHGESGGIDSFYVSHYAEAGDTQIRVGGYPDLKEGQLMTYRSEWGDYYTVTVAYTQSGLIKLNTPLEAPISQGMNLWNFYYDGAHPNLYGFRALADFSLRSQNVEELNWGKHVLLGDSWFFFEGVSQRLAEKLGNAQIINKGVGGNSSAQMLARFDRDVAAKNPDVVWLIAGTNDYYRDVSVEDFTNNMRSLIEKINAIGAKAIVIDSSVAPLMWGSDELTQLSHEYAAAVARLLEQ
ncbi:MAG: hypothetical protein CSB47_01925 [Proteobacteria bacterium]|nr:MAG: hypothetical protein CSB47_01925 [Pseudomonadota bacterium]